MNYNSIIMEYQKMINLLDNTPRVTVIVKLDLEIQC